MEDELANWWINEIKETKTDIPLSIIKKMARDKSNF